MKHRKFACLLGAVLLACASAVAQPPQLPDPNQLPNVPKPQIQLKPRDPGAPLPMQTTLPVQNFAVSDLKCAANLASATQRLVAKLTILPGPIMRTTAEIDTVIDGVSVGKQTLPIQSGAVVVDRTITVRGGASAQHQAVFVLDNAVRSASQAFSHACVSATQPRAAAPGVIAQETQFAFVASVKDGLRAPPSAASSGGSELKLELETTDGRSFEFVKTGGIPDNSVVRIEGTVPVKLDRESLHRVRLYINDAPLQGFDRIGDQGDAASFAWMLIETGRPEAAKSRIFETGEINLTLPPKQWWQTQILQMRRVRADTPVVRLAVQVLTGPDDLRVGPMRTDFRSLIEVALPFSLDLGGGATMQSEMIFGNQPDDELRRYQELVGVALPPLLTAAEEASIQSAAALQARDLRIKRMLRSFLMTPDGVHLLEGTGQRRPFGSHGMASTQLILPQAMTLADIGGVFLRVSPGAGGTPFNTTGAAQGFVDADQWDYAGVTLLYRTTQNGPWLILFSDKRPERVSSPKTFEILVPQQTLRQ